MADKQKFIPSVLLYIGPDPAVVGIVPLPEGWPAEDHTDGVDERYAAKVASGMYKPAPPAGEKE